MNHPTTSIPAQATASQPDVDELVCRLRAGDHDALAELFSLYSDRFHRLIDVRLHWSLRGRLDVADVMQEAYIDARERLTHFFSREDGTIFVWLRLIVLQRLLLLERFHLQASKRNASMEVRLNGDDRSGRFGSLSQALAASITSPSAAAHREEAIALVDRLLTEMEPIDREILMLRHFEQLPNKEVAEILGVGVTAASNRYVRALRRLKDLVEESQLVGSSSHAPS
ncbi:MAG: sigma-70 family RNA polymerase sigma factor [Planctomycetaceae bacterium]|nr:sigma-70 family RNA polymerase sigma factor [Planctomycetaceae bacterium]